MMRKVTQMFIASLFLAATVMVAGCGDKEDKGKDEKKDAKANSSKTVAKKGDEADSAEKMVAVSINLPGMTWGGCESSVKKALGSVAGISNIKTDRGSKTATFEVEAGVDFESELNKLAEDASTKLKDWSAN